PRRPKTERRSAESGSPLRKNRLQRPWCSSQACVPACFIIEVLAACGKFAWGCGRRSRIGTAEREKAGRAELSDKPAIQTHPPLLDHVLGPTGGYAALLLVDCSKCGGRDVRSWSVSRHRPAAHRDV